MHLFTSLLLLIVVARILGHLMTRLRQPAIIGELAAGVLLGPSVLDVVHMSEPLAGIAGLAIFFIVLSAGMEMKFDDIVSAARGRGMLIALMSFAMPLAAGLLIGLFAGLPPTRTMVLALCMSITALPVAVRILESFGLLNSRIARYSIACAVINDLVALMLLGLLLDVPRHAGFAAVAGATLTGGGKLILLIAVIVGMEYALRAITGSGPGRTPSGFAQKVSGWFGGEAMFGVVVLFVLVFASISEMLGFHSVIGAFFGGLLISREMFVASRYNQLEQTINSVSRGFLAPVFFATLGLEFSIKDMPSWWFVGIVLAASIAFKILPGWIGGRMAGLSKPEALGLGFMLNGRGVMELVVAQIALDRGFISLGLFSTLVLMGVVTTLMTPLLFRLVSRRIPRPEPQPAQPAASSGSSAGTKSGATRDSA
ncbi:MAG TPA: cation:proton antiporter [Kiritimatiellia bacterium]|nr:cation:proton antiporter [Kiritimatiellia bacterium]